MKLWERPARRLQLRQLAGRRFEPWRALLGPFVWGHLAWASRS